MDEEGEILVQGATLFQGYLEGDAVQQPFGANGWFHTGDLGWIDADGFLHVRGRMDNMFISGGENIQPEEIEAALSALPGVSQAVVVPVADDEFGQRPIAFVRGTDEALPLETLADQLEDLLPRFKIPHSYYPWPAIAEGMKVSRAAFRRHAEELVR